jgi:signal transduction histidine kinase
VTIRQFRWLQAAAFAGIIAAGSVVAVLVLLNILRWSGDPIFGYFIRATGRTPTVGLVLAQGREAGLEVGDRIVAVNGQPVASLAEIRAIRRSGPGSVNTYAVQRDDRPLDVTIATRPLGLWRALLVFGLPWAVGLVFIGLGVVVFLMKPFDRAAWAFLLFSFVSGVFLMFIYRNVLRPAWLDIVSLAALAFLPAAILHLGLTFPVERSWFARRRLALLAPYALSLALTALFVRSARLWEDIPLLLKTAWLAGLVVAIAALLGATAHAHWRAASAIGRLRARVMLLGFGVGAGVPALESVLNAVLDVYVLPHSTWLVPFFVFVPLAVGYAIVKHNLFDIDAVIRRTTGWLLLTGGVVALYASLVAVLDVAVRQWAVAPSPVVPAFLTLLLVLLLNPLRDRAQGVVDRVFYRTRSDYRETVRRVAAALTSVIALDVVIDRVLQTLTLEMHIETAAVLLRAETGGAYRVDRAEGARAAEIGGQRLEETRPVIRLLSRGGLDLLARDEVAEGPKYAAVRPAVLGDLERLGATLLVPLVFTGELIGLLAIGPKRSGRPYTAEDVALLTTLAHQSAIAINNATAFSKLEELRRTLEERVARRTDELAALNLELARSNERLKALDQLKSDFVQDVAHELRTPLAAIRGYLDCLLEGLAGEVPPAQKELLEITRGSTERLTRLITDLLDLARIEAGRVEFHPRPLSLGELVEDVIDELRTLAAGKGVDLAGVIPRTDLLVAADRDKLHQILLNLGDNAVKFTPPGGRVRVTAAAGDEATVVITVEDTGEGIPVDELAQVFDRFYQVRDPGASPRGSGLGLTITKRLVDLHGGTIRVTGAPGGGSAFVVCLPAAGPGPGA